MKKFIVTAVDTSDSSDGKPRALKACNSLVEARAFVYDDMKCYEEAHAGDELDVDYDRMSVSYKDDALDITRCEWNIDELNIS